MKRQVAVVSPAPSSAIADLLPVLRALDAMLDRASQVATSVWSSDSVSERFRGLYISQEDVARMLKRAPGESPIKTEGLPLDCVTGGSRLSELQRRFSLSAFDCAVLVIALAPEIDLRYERLYAFLQ